MKKIVVILAILFLLFFSYFLFNSYKKQSQTSYTINNQLSHTMKITSPAFENNQFIPTKFTCDGENINPALEINNVPAKAKSLALIVDDPDSPSGTYVHWVMYNLNPQDKDLDENAVPPGALQSVNGAGQEKYTGPCPSSGTHHYRFKIYALDTDLNFSNPPDAKTLIIAMQGHVLDQAELIGLYKRK